VLIAIVNVLAYRGVGPTLSRLGLSWLALLIEGLVYLVGVVALTWAFCRFADHTSVRSLGLGKEGRWTRLIAGWGLGTFLQFLIFALFWIAGWLVANRATWQPVNLFASMVSWIISSFNEELAFRGYILQHLARAWGLRAAVVVSSLIFAFVHVLNPHISPLAMVNLFAAGLLLATAYLVTGSLWLPIGLHIGWNLAELHLLGFASSGFQGPALVHTVVQGPELFTGGAFGPEGGLVGLLVIGMGTVVLFLGSKLAKSSEHSVSPQRL
jgi:membrane protease YdiL (CAAX protease family)